MNGSPRWTMRRLLDRDQPTLYLFFVEHCRHAPSRCFGGRLRAVACRRCPLHPSEREQQTKRNPHLKCETSFSLTKQKRVNQTIVADEGISNSTLGSHHRRSRSPWGSPGSTTWPLASLNSWGWDCGDSADGSSKMMATSASAGGSNCLTGADSSSSGSLRPPPAAGGRGRQKISKNI